MSMKLRVLQEFLIVCLAGCLPIAIAYPIGGTDLLTELFLSFTPKSSVIYYQFALVFPFIFVAVWERFFWKGSDAQRRRWYFARSTFQEVGTSLLALWRVLAGALIAFPISWFFIEPETLNLADAATCFWLGLGLFIECCIFSASLIYVQKRWFRDPSRGELSRAFDTFSTVSNRRNEKALSENRALA